MRGKLGQDLPAAVKTLCSPARAGKTPAKCRFEFVALVHPRACGENYKAVAPSFSCPGSSPRVRGKRVFPHGLTYTPRLVPTCAGKTAHSSTTKAISSAHPRVCGENVISSLKLTVWLGSSPRVRGKPTSGRPRHPPHRLIPACAGKTARRFVDPWEYRAHPRVCGENLHLVTVDEAWAGSSPRMRGKRDRPSFELRPRRLIPACAGKTSKGRSTTALQWAHPRVCGENPSEKRYARMKVGSSPRVRGKLWDLVAVFVNAGLIPACAGKTFPAMSRVRYIRAHPRVCGENTNDTISAALEGGSSPRVRGKLWDLVAVFVNAGLIPACAGKTFPAMSRVRYIRAHPRVCGENTNDTISAALEGGSSPRVRGKHAAASRCFARLGLIPACAGKTRAARLSTSKHEAHPRVCGENLFTFAYKPFVTGSSPRGRGKREPGKPRDRRPRLIPACAGKTTTTSHPTFRSTAHPRACGENHTPRVSCR